MLVLAVWIGALDAGDALGVVPAKNELLHHLGDALDAKTPVDDRVLSFVLIGEFPKMPFEHNGVMAADDFSKGSPATGKVRSD